MQKIGEIIEGVEDFPTLPTIYSKLLDMLVDPHATAEGMAGIISTDPVAATKLLKVVNSPLYGLQGNVDTISQAIVHVGFGEVRNLVLALSVIDLFSKLDSGENFSITDFWKHSIAVGTISRLLAKKLHIRYVENYYIAGILHDIGKIFFLKTFGETYIATVDRAISTGKSLSESEFDKFGINHLEAGRLIAEKWQLPGNLIHAIKYHNDGKVDGEFNREVATICLSDKIANILELGSSSLFKVSKPDPGIWSYMAIQPEMIKSLYRDILEVYSQSVSILSL